MKLRTLGKDGPPVGAVGLGCMSFAGFYGSTDEAESHRTLARAAELGVTHLDTSNVYGAGLSENIIGSFLKKYPQRFSIATKTGIVTGPPRSFNNSKEYMRNSLEESLRRLGVEHVDLFYVHRRDQDIPIEDVTGFMADFVAEGKIGGIGFSEIAPSSLRRAAKIHPVRAVQNEYSLWTRIPELGLIQTCAELGVAFVAFSPLARGMFSDKVPDPAAFSDNDFRRNNPRFNEPNFSYNRDAVQKFIDYCQSQGFHPASVALAWVLQQGDHIIAIPGTRTAKHLEQNALAGDLKLTSEQLNVIEKLLPAGFAHGFRYADKQLFGIEQYC